jgi:hypothetical protein
LAGLQALLSSHRVRLHASHVSGVSLDACCCTSLC